VTEKRTTNSERRLNRLVDEDPPPDGEERGILELFDEPEEAADEDAPLRRDPES
jgi:hypothetical protein